MFDTKKLYEHALLSTQHENGRSKGAHFHRKSIERLIDEGASIM